MPLTPLAGLANYVPADYGLAGWSMDPVIAGNSSIPTAGGLTLVKCKLSNPVTVSTIVLFVATAGVTLANCFAGLYDENGTLLAGSANQATAWQSSGLKEIPITPSVVARACYVGILVGSAGTGPALSRSALSGAVNLGLTGAALRYASSGSGQTALPASVNLAAASAGTTAYLVGVK